MVCISRIGYVEVFGFKWSGFRVVEFNFGWSDLERICVVFSRVYDLWDSF